MSRDFGTHRFEIEVLIDPVRTAQDAGLSSLTDLDELVATAVGDAVRAATDLDVTSVTVRRRP